MTAARLSLIPVSPPALRARHERAARAWGSLARAGAAEHARPRIESQLGGNPNALVERSLFGASPGVAVPALSGVLVSAGRFCRLNLDRMHGGAPSQGRARRTCAHFAARNRAFSTDSWLVLGAVVSASGWQAPWRARQPRHPAAHKGQRCLGLGAGGPYNPAWLFVEKPRAPEAVEAAILATELSKEYLESALLGFVDRDRGQCRRRARSWHRRQKSESSRSQLLRAGRRARPQPQQAPPPHPGFPRWTAWVCWSCHPPPLLTDVKPSPR